MGYRNIKIIEENYIFISKNSNMGFWDICAADAICREMGGGCIETETQKMLSYNKNLRMKVGCDFLLGNNCENLKTFIKENKVLITEE